MSIAPALPGGTYCWRLKRLLLVGIPGGHSGYEDETKDQWFEGWFLPTLAALGLRCISWEELLAVVSGNDEVAGRELGDFYEKCLAFNKFVAKRYG